MSRTQDLVLARLRLIALRWQVGTPGVAEAPGSTDGPGEIAVPGAAHAWARDPGGGDDEVEQGAGEWLDPDGSGHGVAPEDPAGWRSGGDPPDGGPTWPALGLWGQLVGLLVVLVLVGGAAALLTSWPREQPAATVAPSAGASDPFAEPFPAASPSPAASVTVHVVGEVRDPGVVELPAGSRVVDALRAAGGLRRGGELGGTNLARVLADGERLEVGGPETAVAGVAGGPAGSPGGLLDLNSATAEQLDALPGIGPVTAAKILAWRSTHNRFSVVDELAEVPGIGPRTLADLRPLVRV